MSVKSLRWTIVALIAGSPAAMALGLGDIHLHSALNAPLDADIDLIGATPDDLSGLKAQLASRDAFTRNGLDYPAFLSSLSFATVHTEDGRDLINVRSAQAITEPFVTLLVELDWPRGRVAHEYTVLLDPPVYAPGASQAAAAVVAPATGAGNRVGSIQREAPVQRPAPAAPAAGPNQVVRPAPGQTVSGEGGSYTVQRGDSLSRIAGEYAGGAANRQRWMVAAYGGNPGAFDGNMNVLRSGSVLRLPDASQVAAVSTGEASAEVHRQFAAWRAGSGAAGAAPAAAATAGSLHLVTPGAPQAAAPGAGSNAAGVQQVRQALQDLERAAAGNATTQVKQLQSQLAESQRLLQVQQAELARLQSQLAARNGGAAPAPAPTAEQPAAAPAAPPATTAVPEVVASAPGQPASSQASVPRRVPHTQPVPVSGDQGPMGGIIGLLKQYWWALVALAVAVAAWVGARLWRQREQVRFDDNLVNLTAPAAHSTFDESANMGVEEFEGHRQREASPHPVTLPPHVAVDDAGAGPAPGLTGDPADPLAEADFHMAYGLYDQAADLVRMAIQREPGRRDLRLKLLEVFFVWGNKDQFLEAAHGLADTRGQAPAGEWEKILIMGKQLAPEDPLFASGSASGAAAGGVDLDLDAGTDTGLHFDGGSGVDLDIGTALSGDDQDSTSEATHTGLTDRNLALHDLPDDTDAAIGSTSLMKSKHAPGQLDEFDLDGYTVEQPAAASTMRVKVDSALLQTPQVDETAELALDDLGLDVGALDIGNDAEIGHTATGTDAPTLVAGLDEYSRQLLTTTAEQPAPSFGQELPSDTTGKWKFDAGDAALTQLAPAPDFQLPDDHDVNATVSMVGLKSEGLDFDFGGALGQDDGQSNGYDHGGGGNVVDLDVGSPTMAGPGFADTQRISAEDLGLPDLEPVTMSEVGTKLDLARAYMDMGDPEGARNILEEVVNEGSQAQRQEAQRLIASLPG